MNAVSLRKDEIKIFSRENVAT